MSHAQNSGQKPSSSTTHVTDRVLSSFKPTKTFNYHQQASITSLDFDDSGQYLISAGIDKSIQLYDIHKGSHQKDIQSQKYGAHLARFTHHELNCLYASTPSSNNEVDNAIRCLSLADNQYIRYYKGHKGQVTSIEVNPVQNMFLSASMDYSVKLWDLKSSSPIGNIDIGQQSVVTFDPQGIVFAVGKFPDPSGSSSFGSVSFYDVKNMEKGPFASVEVPVLAKQTWNKLEFSNNGKCLLISTDSPEHYLLDAFLGQLLTTLSTSQSLDEGWMSYKYPYTGTSTFSPCGKFLLIGSPQSTVLLFDLNSIKTTDGESHTVHVDDNPVRLQPFKVLNTSQGIAKNIAFNPKLLTFATADNTVSLWQPQDLVR